MTKRDRTKLNKQIDAFLKEPRGDGYDMPDTTQEDLHKLYGIFLTLRDLKERPDCDGDNSLQAVFLSRTLHEVFHFYPVPRQELDLQGYIRAISINHGVSNTMLRVLLDQIGHEFDLVPKKAP